MRTAEAIVCWRRIKNTFFTGIKTFSRIGFDEFTLRQFSFLNLLTFFTAKQFAADTHSQIISGNLPCIMNCYFGDWNGARDDA